MGCTLATDSVVKMGVVDYYYNIASQPCRSVWTFIKLNNIHMNGHVIDLFKGEHKTPEYLAMNPNHTIPTFKEDDFIITQSVVIVKYLAARNKTPDHWYPADIKKRAKVDELLDWHHTNIRKHGAGVFFNIMLGPIFGVPALTPEQIDEKYKDLDGSLTMIETFLKGQKYLCGNEITIADLFIANEVLQPTMCERDIYAKHPKVKAWMGRVQDRLNPVWDDNINKFEKVVDSVKNMRK